MKKLFTKLMAILLIISACVVSAPAMETQAAVKWYKIQGDYVGFNKSNGKLTYAHKKLNYVPASIDGTKVKIIGKWAFNKNTKLKNAKIPSTVTKLEKGAFYECKNLTKVTFSKGSKAKIGDLAFGECAKLKTVVNNPSSDWQKRIDSLNSVTDLLTTLDPQAVRETKTYIWKLKNLDDNMWSVIKKKAEKITEGCSTDREKAKAIYKWVAKIAYDGEWKTDSSKRPEQDPYVLITWDKDEHDGKAASTDCVGHTYLTLALLDSVDIPSVYVYRKAKGSETVGHGWNAAYIDGKWIWIDSTQEFFDPGLAGFVSDSDHKRIDMINGVDLEEYQV